MGKEVDNKFTWVIKNFCSLQSRKVYPDEFVVNGCKWCLTAFPRETYLALYLDVAGSESLPYGWKRHATVQISLVNQVSQELSLTTQATQYWFDSRISDSGFLSMFPLNELHAKDSGFLVNNEVKIVAEVNVLEVIGKLDIADESEEATESLSKVEEDDGAESYDFLKEASSVKESMDVNGFLAEVDVLEVTGKLDVADESKEATKSLSKVEEDYGAESYDSLKETSSVKESMDVHGFQVLPSQVESVSRIFERHPDFASEFCPMNQHLRTAYMNVLLGLIEMLCQSTQELSKYDLTDAAAALEYLTNAGFDLDWLEDKLEEVSEKKKKEEAGETRMQEIEEELKDLKLKCSNLEAELKKEKADVSVARAPLSFDDVV